MTWVFAIVGLVLIVVVGLVVVGRETYRLAHAARPAVFDLAEAVEYIADELPPESQARLSHDDVRWILLSDADLLESATADPDEMPFPWQRPPQRADDDDDDEAVVDEDEAVARILAAADAADRELRDEDVVAVLDARLDYLEAIGAVGGAVTPDDLDRSGPTGLS